MNSRAAVSMLLLLALRCGGSGARRRQPRRPLRCDLLFAGGRVVDGTGAPWFAADVCVAGDRIAARRALAARRRRAASTPRGLVVAPGFIDMLGQSEYNVLVDPRAASKITQGITTEITGEGPRSRPRNARMIADEREVVRALRRHARTARRSPATSPAFEKARPAINLGTFVGAGGVRELVVGRRTARATPDELARWRPLVAAAMEDGALGLSTSLQYVPDRFASTDEIVALAKVAAPLRRQLHHAPALGGARDRPTSLDEVVPRRPRGADPGADLPPQDRRAARTGAACPRCCKRFEQARAEGLDVSRRPVPLHRRRRTGSTRTCRSGCARAAPRRWSRGSRDPAARARVRPSSRARTRAGRTSSAVRRRAPAILIAERREPRAQEVRGPDDRRDRPQPRARTRSTR